MANMFRLLRADEIDARVGTAKKGSTGVSLLLYKDARCDMAILDETVGAFNWKREHSRDNANCTVSLWDSEKGQWVSKEDTGTESNTEAEKGLASDSFKRACFNWGIGRELYTSPFIWINGDPDQLKFMRFKVDDIDYDENRNINYLVISDAKTGKVMYSFGKGAPKAEKAKAEPKPADSLKNNVVDAVKAFCDKHKIDGNMFTSMRNACIEAGLIPRIAYGNMTDEECKAMLKCVEMNMGENR